MAEAILKKVDLPISQIIDETIDTKTFRISLEGRPFPYLTSHFIITTLPTCVNEKGERIPRSYSMSSSPTEEGFVDITIKLVPEGKFTPRLFECRVGDRIQVSGPFGNFLFKEGMCSRAIFIAGGSGVTPFRAMTRYILDKGLKIPVTLFYSARSPKELIFYEQFNQMAKEGKEGDVRCFFTATRQFEEPWEGLRGRINAEMVRANVNSFNDSGTLYYICGLPEFVGQMQAMLKNDFQVPSERIKYEKW